MFASVSDWMTKSKLWLHKWRAALVQETNMAGRGRGRGRGQLAQVGYRPPAPGGGNDVEAKVDIWIWSRCSVCTAADLNCGSNVCLYTKSIYLNQCGRLMSSATMNHATQLFRKWKHSLMNSYNLSRSNFRPESQNICTCEKTAHSNLLESRKNVTSFAW